MTEQTQCDYTGISHSTLPHIWEYVAPLLERALAHAHGEYELEDLRQLIQSGHMQLWIASTTTELRGVVVTELLTYPQKRVCHFVFVSGDDLDSWLGLEQVIEVWAYQRGAEIIRGMGRRGWKRALAVHGFEESYTMFDKVISVTGKEKH